MARRRVDAAARFGRGHALHAVHAALVFQPAVDAAAFDGRDDFLQPADAGVACSTSPRGASRWRSANLVYIGTARPRKARLRRRRCRRGFRGRRSSRRWDPSGSRRIFRSATRRVAMRDQRLELLAASSRMSASPRGDQLLGLRDFLRRRSVSRGTVRPAARAPASAFGVLPVGVRDRSAPRTCRAGASGPRSELLPMPVCRTCQFFTAGARRLIVSRPKPAAETRLRRRRESRRPSASNRR